LREDFFYRISAVRLKLPPLRERKEDIPLLLMHLLNKGGNDTNYNVNADTVKLLMQYEYPGNIREFENVIRRVKALSKNGNITTDLLPYEIQSFENKTFKTDIPKLEDLEKEHILSVLKMTTNPKEAAKFWAFRKQHYGGRKNNTVFWRNFKLK
jgi:transcriptional regulator with PAS, ATPase and Fis domain